MYKKNKIIIEIDDMDKFAEIIPIVKRNCELQMGGSGDFDIQGKANNDNRAKFGIYKFDENHTLKELINELGELCKYVTFKDIDSKEVLQYIGRIIISFDKIESIKFGTFDKLDELKVLKTEFGYCKGYKPNIRLMEGTYAVNMRYSESIYLISDSLDNLIKLDSIIENKLLKFDSNFELDFELVD